MEMLFEKEKKILLIKRKSEKLGKEREERKRERGVI